MNYATGAISVTFSVAPANATAITAAYDANSGAFIAVNPDLWRGVRSLEARSGTVAAPVNQVNAVALQLITRSVF